VRGAVWFTFLHRGSRANRVSDSQGALSIPLLLALLAISCLGLATWGMMRHWRHLTELQLKLDRCVGDTALDLKRALQEIERANRHIQMLRAAQAASGLAGGVGELRPLMILEARRQDLEILRWNTKQARWLVQRGCGGAGGVPLPLPSMKWFRAPPDPIGPQPLEWAPGMPRILKLQLTHTPRAAAAVVQPGEGNETSWKASWTVPGKAFGLLGTSTH
jgi:hypothetical protein